MKEFYRETDGIWRLEVPFFTVYTSVFLIDTSEGYVLVDCATTDKDVDECIIPAIKNLGISLSEVKKIVITHDHSDHAGGLTRIKHHIPHIEVVRDTRALSVEVSTYPLPGHTKDFVGVFDSRTGTLISGDGLQGAGIKQYRTMLADKAGYLETIEKIRADERIKNVLFSHEYEPWYKNSAMGRENVLTTLSDCLKYVKKE